MEFADLLLLAQATLACTFAESWLANLRSSVETACLRNTYEKGPIIPISLQFLLKLFLVILLYLLTYNKTYLSSH